MLGIKKKCNICRIGKVTKSVSGTVITETCNYCGDTFIVYVNPITGKKSNE